MRPGFCIAAIGLALGALPSRVQASPADLWGWGSESIARSGAVTASADGPEAAFYNPAGLARSDTLKLEINYLHVFSKLSYQTDEGSVERSIPISDHVGLGFVWPILPQLSLGIATMLPVQSALRIDQRAADSPAFPYLENRSQRLSLFPALGVRPLPWLTMGLGLNFFAEVQGDIVTTEGPTRASESTIMADATTHAALNAGLGVRANSWLAFALVYRQAFAVPYRITTRNLVGGTPLNVDVQGEALPTPHELIVGSAFSTNHFQLNIDAAWRMWSHVSNPFVGVDAVVSGIDLGLRVPATPYRDTFAIRSGAVVPHELTRQANLEYRLGASLETTQVGEQTGRTNLIDAPKLGFSGGLGLRLTGPLAIPIRFDLHLALLYQLSRRYDKQVSTVSGARDDPNVLADEDSDLEGVQISNPGYPSLVGDAIAVSTGFSISLEFAP